MDIYEKKGYLRDNFRLFHLSDKNSREYEFHYHDFYKLLLLIKGNVNYSIEGKTYALNPYDIVLVNPGEIHRPVILNSNGYERIIIYISPEFLESHKEECNLKYCFAAAKEHDSHVLRLPALTASGLYEICEKTETESNNADTYGKMLAEVKFLEFLILLNREAVNRNTQYIHRASDSKVQNITRYINDNIKEELNIDIIASRFFLSRYHLMHIFKTETGCTLMGYITQKRLLLAKSLIQKGKTVTEAYMEAGFKNYNSFFRAYKNNFGMAPKKK